MITFILTILLGILFTFVIYFPIKYIKNTQIGTLVSLIGGVLIMFGGLYLSIPFMQMENKIAKEITIKQQGYNPDSVFEYITAMRISNPKVVMAQAIEESGNFKSDVYKNANNMFGMKKPYVRISTIPYIDYKGYKKYKNWQECIIDYAFWQLQNTKSNLSDLEYIDMIAKKYAENPNYKKNLLKIYNSLKYE